MIPMAFKSIRTIRFAFAVAALGLIAVTPAQAHVASIDGEYDTAFYDTPDLVFHNTSAFDFTNVKLTLTGYQGLNNGLVQSTGLSDIIAGTSSTYIWLGSTTPGNLFAYDYDDSYGVAPNQVGNFYVTFTAKWNGLDVFSQFSPTTNATGGFVGWEGLDPNGFAENFTYDTHNGTLNGTLAYIDFGTPPPIDTPVPSSLVMSSILCGMLGTVWACKRLKRNVIAA
jgi:hypothetical protein